MPVPTGMETPQADRVPRRQILTRETSDHTLESDWTDLVTAGSGRTTSIFLKTPSDGLVIPQGHNAYGAITVTVRGVDTVSAPVSFFVAIGSSSTTQYIIPAQIGDVGTLHSFFVTPHRVQCNEGFETVEEAYPPSAIIDNAHFNPDFPQFAITVNLSWTGSGEGYGCESTAEAKVSLTYEVDISSIEPDPLDEPLHLWGEDLCSNTVFLPAVPRRDHPELGLLPRAIGFLEDRNIEKPIAGRHSIPERFFELFSANKTRMVEEEPAFTGVSRIEIQSPWVTLASGSDRETRLLVQGIPALPSTGNVRGTIVVHIRGVDTRPDPAFVNRHFFVRLGGGDSDDSYDIPTDHNYAEFEFFPFFSGVTPSRPCAEMEQTRDDAYPPRAIFKNATVASDGDEEAGPWDLAMFLRWQGPAAGFYGDCGDVTPEAQVELHYQVFAGPETPDEVCKYSYASMVIGPDGFARGFFCSQHDFINVREFQENHYATAFVNRGTADFSEPEDGQRDFSVSQQVLPGMCGFIGAFHAPRWTELLLYSQRATCEEIV